MAEVPAQKTSPGTRDAWRPSRYSALVDGLLLKGLSMPDAQRVGLMLLPLVARETGWGNAEYNFNVGNLRPSAYGRVAPPAPGWHGDYNVRTHGQYRAYDTLVNGTYDFLRLLTTSRYNPAYQHLVSTGDVAGFYEQLIRAGYYPADEAEIQTARREYESMYRSVQALNLPYIPGASTSALAGNAAGTAGTVATVVFVMALGVGGAMLLRRVMA